MREPHHNTTKRQDQHPFNTHQHSNAQHSHKQPPQPTTNPGSRSQSYFQHCTQQIRHHLLLKYPQQTEIAHTRHHQPPQPGSTLPRPSRLTPRITPRRAPGESTGALISAPNGDGPGLSTQCSQPRGPSLPSRSQPGHCRASTSARTGRERHARRTADQEVRLLHLPAPRRQPARRTEDPGADLPAGCSRDTWDQGTERATSHAPSPAPRSTRDSRSPWQRGRAPGSRPPQGTTAPTHHPGRRATRPGASPPASLRPAATSIS